MKEENVAKEIEEEKKLKEKYGKLYKITSSIIEDEETEEQITVSFLFKKPLTPSLNRYLKTANKNMTASTSAFLMDNIIDEQKEQLKEKMAEYPALSIGIGEKLLNVLGLSSNVNLTKL